MARFAILVGKLRNPINKVGLMQIRNVFRMLLQFFAVGLVVGCVSRGSAVKKLSDDRFEVRAWDGYGCTKTADNNTCFTLLMPVIKGKAEERCEGGVKAITPCLRYEATTADRIFCKVECEPDEDEEDEKEEKPVKKKSKKKEA
jgi:hypothetical protein